ncbi:LacI family DNA-binding transcriptional regulator [Novosphingobium terrae]|uniref:LacI family DNA-binding transcriptional regulator n=1 Tax=Novosphingobium terrae TaxID=2726189 RepID=UPI001F12E758|nr:LacI family DNA-binding transcriptional regulator [Novosphingobium terrae]
MKARRSKTGQVTIREVAEKAGVSAMTVSNVLNRKGRVGEAARARVQQAIGALGYRSAADAGRGDAIRGGPVRIGLIHHDVDTIFVRTALASASSAAAVHDVQLLLRPQSDDAPEAILACARELLAEGAGALLVMPPFAEALSGSPAIADLGVPLLALVTGRPLPDMATLRIDNHAASFALTSLLLDQGHRRIGVIAGPSGHSDSLARLAGHQAAMAARGFAEDPALVAQGAFTFDSGVAWAKHLLSLPQPPTAIAAANDDMAAGVIWEAHRRGLRLPDELAVTGFDDSLVATRVWPALTTVRQPIDAMTHRAFALLLAMMDEGAACHDELADFTVIERDSTQMQKALVV